MWVHRGRMISSVPLPWVANESVASVALRQGIERRSGHIGEAKLASFVGGSVLGLVGQATLYPDFDKVVTLTSGVYLSVANESTASVALCQGTERWSDHIGEAKLASFVRGSVLGLVG